MRPVRYYTSHPHCVIVLCWLGEIRTLNRGINSPSRCPLRHEPVEHYVFYIHARALRNYLVEPMGFEPMTLGLLTTTTFAALMVCGLDFILTISYDLGSSCKVSTHGRNSSLLGITILQVSPT